MSDVYMRKQFIVGGVIRCPLMAKSRMKRRRGCSVFECERGDKAEARTVSSSWMYLTWRSMSSSGAEASRLAVSPSRTDMVVFWVVWVEERDERVSLLAWE